jgi:hypothetical protein
MLSIEECYHHHPVTAEVSAFTVSIIFASLPARSAESWGMAAIRLIKHEAVPNCGSFEVRFPDGRPSRYFYWDDLPSGRLTPDLVDGKTALEAAKAFARAELERLGPDSGAASRLSGNVSIQARDARRRGPAGMAEHRSGLRSLVPKRRDDDAVNGAVCRLVTDDAGGNINRWLVTDRIGFRRMFQATKHCGIEKHQTDQN